jgi:albonoursin synthase
MQILEAIFSRRSIRAFTPDPISDQDMETIIRAAAAAPSGGNAQMWAFISIRDPRRIAALRALSPGIIGVPSAVVVICLDTRRRTAKEEGLLAAMPYFDLGAAMQNMFLAAGELGLGGCAIGSFHPEGVAAFLKLPAAVQPCLLVVLGKPRVIPQSPRKRPLGEVYFQEKYEPTKP